MRFSWCTPISVLLIAAFTMVVACAPPPPRPVTRQTYSPAPPAGPVPPTLAELAAGKRAVSPPSFQAAQAAAMDHINSSLKDPYSAQYRFYRPVNSYHVGDEIRQFGWFMCGLVNAKNSYGGYTGESFFIAYFDPYDGTRVVDSAIESGDYQFVEKLCNSIYNNQNATEFTGPETDPSSASTEGGSSPVFTSGNVFNIEDVDKLKPRLSTESDAKELLGPPSSETNTAQGTKLLQWIFSQATSTSGRGAHVAILFDQYGRMIRVQHKFSTGQ